MLPTPRTECSNDLGFTVLELLVSLALLSAILGIAVSNLRTQSDALDTATANFEGFLKQVRAKAIGSTLAYTVNPTSGGYIQTRTSQKCSSTTKTVDARLYFRMPSSVTTTSTAWTVCYSPRGFPDTNLQITLQKSSGTTRRVEVMLGGAVRTL